MFGNKKNSKDQRRLMKDLRKTYEILMATLAIVVVIILYLEFTRPLTEEQANLLTKIDFSILAIFAVDYFYRLAKAEKKWSFIKTNIFDLVAIMPFDKVFRIARLARIVRLARFSRMLRFTKFIRVIALGHRIGNSFSGVLKTNGLVYVILATFLIILGGAFGIMAFEPGMDNFGDAIWWSLVTTTTVGYGDISPETTGGRVIAGILMVVGIGFLGMVTGSVATYFVNRLSCEKNEKKKSFTENQLIFIKNQIDNLGDMDLEDVKSLNKTIITIWKEVKNKEGIDK